MTNLKPKNDTDKQGASSQHLAAKMRPTLVAGGLLGAVAIFLGGCAQGTTADNGNHNSYTAARHSSLGSHIPQPESADSANATAATGIQAEQTEQMTQAGNVATQSAPTGGGR
jgi:hypothetical protein